jgi:hypothetical protein
VAIPPPNERFNWWPGLVMIPPPNERFNRC